MKSEIVFVCAVAEECNRERELFGFPIIYTGVGKINAAYKTALAIEKYGPKLVCNFGSCGSFFLAKGILSRVKEVVNGDMDATPLVPYSVTPFCKNGGKLEIFSSGVSCFSSDSFINREKVKLFHSPKEALLNKSDIFEMELYAIAQVCLDLKVELISYKWVSDDGCLDDWRENCKHGFEEFKKMFTRNHLPSV